MSWFFILFFLLCTTMCLGGKKSQGTGISDYLQRYGYLTYDDMKRGDGAEALGLMQFQSTMGIRPSGKLDAVTVNLLRSPRCGEKDIHPHNTGVHSLTAKISETGVVKYNVKEWSDRMPLTIQNQSLNYVFNAWAKDWAVEVVWSEIDPDVNIVINAGKKRRSGGSRSLTDVLTEVKMENNVYTIYFYSTAAEDINTFTRTSQHALGHVFGRQHSDLHSIMSPIIRDDDDMIFSKRNCDISLTGAFSHLTTGKSYLVKGNLVWTLKTDSRQPYALDYPPQKISQVFQDIPDTFDDAASYGKNYQTYVFKGSKYWRFAPSSTKVDKGYPRPISKGGGWVGIPDDIDAAFTDHKLQTYFLKGDLLYKYHHDNESVWSGYPKKISDEWTFPRLTETIFDTVFHYYDDDNVYFFKGLFYWKMDSANTITGPWLIKYDWKNLCIPTGYSDMFL